MKYTGTIIKESLTSEVCLTGLNNKVTEVLTTEKQADFQPEIWTIINFTNDDDLIEDLAGSFSRDIKDRWYCDIQTESHTYVIFKDKIFKYLRHDQEERRRIKEYGIRQGIPENQLDWA